MANEAGKNERRLAIQYWDGLNAVVSKGLARAQEFSHVENARSKTIGTVEKREGQTVLGTDSYGNEFVARENYALAYVATGFEAVNGLYRLSASSETTPTPPSAPVYSYSVSVNEAVSVADSPTPFVLSAREVAKVEVLELSESVSVSSPALSASVFDSIIVQDQGMPSVAGAQIYLQTHSDISVVEVPMNGVIDRYTMYISNDDYSDVNIYKLDSGYHWNELSDADAQNLAAADFSHTQLDGKVFFVNGRDYNRYVEQDGSTIVTSRHNDELAGLGDLYNSPRAALVNSYKGRLYLANFTWEGVRNGNTVLQSSPPLGIVSLVTTDTPSSTGELLISTGKSFFAGTLDDDLIEYWDFNDTLDVFTGQANGIALSAPQYPVTGTVSPGDPRFTLTDPTEIAPLTIGMKFISTFVGVPTSSSINGFTLPDIFSMSSNFDASGGGSSFMSSDTPSSVTGHVGLGIDLTGATRSKLRRTSISSSGTSFAMSMYIKSGVSSAAELGVASFGNSITGYQYEIHSQNTDGQFNIIFKVYYGTTVLTITEGTTLGEWHNAVLSFDGTTLSASVDGVPTGAATSSTGSAFTVIDGFAVGGSYMLKLASDVYLDEVGVWDRSLTAVEMEELSNHFYGYAEQWQLPMTDTTYVYSDIYANEYEIWRINEKIADVTINKVDDLNIYAYSSDIEWAGTNYGFLSQDQLYVKGSVTGPKVYRWPNNPTLSGQDVKQYSTFKLSGEDESDITMMVNVGNVMLVSNRSIMASWNDYILNYFDLGIGCASRRGYSKAYGALYFVHYTGIYATSGGMPNIISGPIQPYIDGATKEGIENSVAGKKGRSMFFCIGDVTLYNADGSVNKTLTDTCLEYNILQQNWYVHTNVASAEFETYLDGIAEDRLAFLDSTSKDVKLFLDGTTDDGAEIFFRVDTQKLPISANLEDLSNAELVIVESERGSSMECYVSFDDETFYQIEGTLEKGITRLRVNGRDPLQGQPPIGHYITVSFRDSSKQRCKLGRVAITFVPAGVSDPP